LVQVSLSKAIGDQMKLDNKFEMLEGQTVNTAVTFIGKKDVEMILPNVPPVVESFNDANEEYLDDLISKNQTIPETVKQTPEEVEAYFRALKRNELEGIQEVIDDKLDFEPMEGMPVESAEQAEDNNIEQEQFEKSQANAEEFEANVEFATEANKIQPEDYELGNLFDEDS